MISDLKLGMKMLRYTYNRKITLVCGTVIFILGIIVLILGGIGGSSDTSGAFGAFSAGGYLIILTAMFPTQLLSSISTVNMILASPARKKLQTSVLAKVSGCSMLGMYLLNILIRGVIAAVFPAKAYALGNALIMDALVALIIMIYLAIAYKYFVFATIIFLVTYFSVYTLFSIEIDFHVLPQGVSAFPMAALLGIVIILAGSLLGYGITLLIYKKPMSKRAQAAGLRKEL